MSSRSSSRSGRRKRSASRPPPVGELNFKDSPGPLRASDALGNSAPGDFGWLALEDAARTVDRADASADDLTPQALLDEDEPDSPISDAAQPADASLRLVSAGEIFSEPPEPSLRRTARRR